jgi:hypothetical protein
MQCTNHVKQISLALHNFADVYKEVLPSDGYVGNINSGPYTKDHRYDTSSVVSSNASVLVSILPYVEQQAIYENFNFGATETKTNDLPDAVPGTLPADIGWGIIVPAGTSAAQYLADIPVITNAKINYFTCPSGNHSGAKSSPFAASYVGIAGGTNYLADGNIAPQALTFGASPSAQYISNISAAAAAAAATVTTANVIPANFQAASLGNGVFPVGKAGTLKMADGTSNTIAFGEISWDAGATDNSSTLWTAGTPPNHYQLGAWYKGAQITYIHETDTATNYQSYYTKVVTPFDVTKLTAGDSTLTGVATGTAGQSHKILNGGKNKTTEVAAGKKAYVAFQRASNAGSWGSNHTSVVVFGLGDGSVRGISDTVANNIICNLAASGDGVAVTLP